MGHLLEQYNGKTSFALVGKPAWHYLGQVFEEGTILSVTEMLQEAFLANWNVRTEPWEIPQGYNVDKPFSRIIRDNPHGQGIDILGQALETYTPAQNEALGAFGDALTEGGAVPESAGSIKGGRQVFMSWKLPHGMVLDANGRADKVETYLLVTTSHDGSASTKACTTPIRVVCNNTMTMALNNAKQMVSIRHTKNAALAIDEAQTTLRLSFSYMDAFQKEVEALIQTEVTNQQVHDIFNLAYAMPNEDNGKASLTKWEAKQDEFWEIYGGATCANITGTAWGAYNALTEQLDYFTKPRKGNSEPVLAAASGFDTIRNSRRNELLKIVKAVALA